MSATHDKLAEGGVAKTAPRPLNYDPADPDKMRLPVGITCGDCGHIRRCKLIYGHTEADIFCDWSPSRFVHANRAASPTAHEAQKD